MVYILNKHIMTKYNDFLNWMKLIIGKVKASTRHWLWNGGFNQEVLLVKLTGKKSTWILFCDTCLQNSIVIRTMIYMELIKNNMFVLRVWKWSFKTMLAICPMSLNNWNTRLVKTRYMIHWTEAVDKHSCTA